ncbi:MAG TPA: baseplate J/gp47 family protein [Thermoanaerobaculia bacterium]|nr:baseplate J/gp47 family protein [Thermoanaerobaculia bacterium]
MTYVAEPYVQFVDDLLNALTGGETRQRFVYAPPATYPVAAADPVIAATLRVFGQARGGFRLFVSDRDYRFEQGEIRWQTADPAAVLPDEGTPFYANFEAQRPPGSLPPLTDRHPGSVTRLLAESFAREYAVLSGQLEGIYRSGFLATATGRDLDEVVRLVGLTRRSGAFAVGTAVFSRLSPAPADIQIEAGTRLSTVKPPAASFETTEDRTLRRGELTVETPIAATAPGAAGVVPAKWVAAIDRPILGVDSVENPQATRLIGDEEGDDALRRRAERAHERAGKATTGALLAALTSVPGLREKDVRILQDHLAHPGVVKLEIVKPVTTALSTRELEDFEALIRTRIEETRPVGVRVLHRLDLADVTFDEQSQPAPGVALWPERLSDTPPLLKISAIVKVIPAAASLRQAERSDLDQRVHQAVDAFFDEIGIGETVIYNRLIAVLMSLDGVLDIVVDLAADLAADADPRPRQLYRTNLYPGDPGLRPTLAGLQVEIAGQLVLLSVTVKITLLGVGLLGNVVDNRRAALDDVAVRLQNGLRTSPAGTITLQVLRGYVASKPNYGTEVLSYQADYMDAGVRIRQLNPEINIASGETVWIGRVVDGGPK